MYRNKEKFREGPIEVTFDLRLKQTSKPLMVQKTVSAAVVHAYTLTY